MGLGIGEWVNGYFVTITTSPERIYVRVRKYKAGASVEQPPDFDKTVLLDNNEHNRRCVNAYKGTLCDYVARLQISIGGYAVIEPRLTNMQKRLVAMS